MKIKDVITELQRFNPEDNLVIFPTKGDDYEEFTIVPRNTERSSVAIRFEGEDHATEIVELEGRIEKLCGRMKEIRANVEDFKTADECDKGKIIELILNTCDRL